MIMGLIREGVTKIRGLIAIEVFEVSDSFIYYMRQNELRKENIWDRFPEYTINMNEGANGEPIPARYYLQFAGSFEPKEGEEENKYLLFNINPCDIFIDEEFREGGTEYMFEGHDFREILKPFLPTIPIKDIKSFNYFRAPAQYIIMEITYITNHDYYSGGYDTDVEYEVIGYLDKDLNKVLYSDVLAEGKTV
jgi:hypothetical protein